MKKLDLKAMTFILALSLSAFKPLHAKEGGDSGGGGDASEARVDEIRSDLLKWIQDGGAQELTLPADISYGEYIDKMSDILTNKKVALSFTNDPVKVQGQDKTCRGAFIETKTLFSKKKYPQILCNITRFKETAEPTQYSLIHHEYAGLKNIEKNDGSASDYQISNQITDFLEDRIVKKLAVKKKPEVEIKPDTSLQKLIANNVNTFKKEETLNECRPFHDQLLKDQQEKFESKMIEINDLSIKAYYEKNKLTKVVDTKVINKSIEKSADSKRTIITYLFEVNAGEDSTQIKFEMKIHGEYKTRYVEEITNYVDKIGRIKKSELYCSLDNFYEVGIYDDYLDKRPRVIATMTNAESGYEIQTEVPDSGYRLLYESGVFTKKELK